MGRLLVMLVLLVVARHALGQGVQWDGATGVATTLGSVSMGADAWSGAGGTLLIVLLTVLAVILIRKFGALE